MMEQQDSKSIAAGMKSDISVGKVMASQDGEHGVHQVLRVVGDVGDKLRTVTGKSFRPFADLS